MAARLSDTRTKASQLLGPDYDPSKLKRVAAVEAALGKRQGQLREQLDEGKLTLEAYLETHNKVLEKAFLKAEEILGADDFGKLYGANWRDQAGFLDRQSFERDNPPALAGRSAVAPVVALPVSGPLSTVQSETAVITSRATSGYANFARVVGTPEEVIVDFAINSRSFATLPESLELCNRIVMNPFTTKRLTAALGLVIQRHEASFGAIELDANRRASLAQGPAPFPRP